MRWRLRIQATEKETSKSISKPYLFPFNTRINEFLVEPFRRIYYLSDPNSDFVFSSTAFASCFILSGSILKLTSTLLLSVSRVVDILNQPRTKPMQIAIARKTARTKSTFFIVVIPGIGLKCQIRYRPIGTRPIKTRISKINSTKPIPPLGKKPQSRLCGQVGKAPITIKISSTSRTVPNMANLISQIEFVIHSRCQSISQTLCQAVFGFLRRWNRRSERQFVLSFVHALVETRPTQMRRF